MAGTVSEEDAIVKSVVPLSARDLFFDSAAMLREEVSAGDTPL